MLAGLLVLGARRLSAHEDLDRNADDAASRNMKLVGFNDLQARSTYQPTLHKQGGRYYIYAGHHAYGAPGEGSAPAGTPPLPKVNNEENGTSIVDVTNPRHPKYVIHIPVPIGKITVQDFVTDTGNPDLGTVRDIVFVTSEATANYCAGQVRHMSWTVDATDEGRPQSIDTDQVSAASGRFCDRGGRFGPHATNEEFGGPFYQKLVFTSQFNAGVRVTDVRDPYNLKEAAFFIPAVNANTDLRCGPYQGNPNKCVQVVQTNNVATDDRGFVYIVDRADSGMHVLRLTGDAARIAGLSDDDD